MIVTNIAAPSAKTATTAAENVRSRKRSRGRIGSLARRSWKTNDPSRTAAKAKSPITTGEPQGYSVPPQTAPSSPAATREEGSADVVDRVLFSAWSAHEAEPDHGESES